MIASRFKVYGRRKETADSGTKGAGLPIESDLTTAGAASVGDTCADTYSEVREKPRRLDEAVLWGSFMCWGAHFSDDVYIVLCDMLFEI
jgi:hypothetical protein